MEKYVIMELPDDRDITIYHPELKAIDEEELERRLGEIRQLDEKTLLGTDWDWWDKAKQILLVGK